jgi:membrane-bound ClpP family serine protease
MSHGAKSTGLDLDAAFKAFGAVGILISVVLIVGVLALTDPFGNYVTTSPAVFGSLLSTVLLVAVGYAAYALRRR